MKNWQVAVIVAVIAVIAIGGWYLYDQQNRTLLSVETPGGSIDVNETSDGVELKVNGQ